jgi:hypothetical protein
MGSDNKMGKSCYKSSRITKDKIEFHIKIYDNMKNAKCV